MDLWKELWLARFVLLMRKKVFWVLSCLLLVSQKNKEASLKPARRNTTNVYVKTQEVVRLAGYGSGKERKRTKRENTTQVLIWKKHNIVTDFQHALRRLPNIADCCFEIIHPFLLTYYHENKQGWMLKIYIEESLSFPWEMILSRYTWAAAMTTRKRNSQQKQNVVDDSPRQMCYFPAKEHFDYFYFCFVFFYFIIVSLS